MSKTEILAELPKLSREELAEVQAKLDELIGGGDGWEDNGELSEADKRELEADLEEYRKSPNEGVSWEEAKAQILAKLRR